MRQEAFGPNELEDCGGVYLPLYFYAFIHGWHCGRRAFRRSTLTWTVIERVKLLGEEKQPAKSYPGIMVRTTVSLLMILPDSRPGGAPSVLAG
eukprot:1065487-Pleurochrysis_carterae.AAC.1